MERKQKVGRNDPCPCGSGKKYKHCCGAVADLIHFDKALDSVHFNAKIAYLGTIGRKRHVFCIKYIQHKKKLIEPISSKQIQAVQSQGKTVSCHKGCCYCCDEIFSISIQEAEAIVYYLYQHQNTLNAFIQAFPRWLAQARKHEDIFMRRQQVATKGLDGQISFANMVDALGKEAASYWKLHIHCPFLNDSECLIYEVRPWACASLFSTTPTEWCNPSSIHEPSIYWTKLPTTPDLPFWDARIAGHYQSNMPDMVYRLLTESIKFLWELPGLEKLREEFLSDLELRDFVKQLVKRSTTHQILA
jgi:Fe-S-cluster containining protein